ncbi:MAG: hypothetical protein IIY60_09710 [Clostridia bacterium]|nr:hypothetical protein [Clostridia bacterium]
MQQKLQGFFVLALLHAGARFQFHRLHIRFIRRVLLACRFIPGCRRDIMLLGQLCVLFCDDLYPVHRVPKEHKSTRQQCSACCNYLPVPCLAFPVHQVIKPNAQNRSKQAKLFRSESFSLFPSDCSGYVCGQRFMFDNGAVRFFLIDQAFRETGIRRSLRQKRQDSSKFTRVNKAVDFPVDFLIFRCFRRADYNQPLFLCVLNPSNTRSLHKPVWDAETLYVLLNLTGKIRSLRIAFRIDYMNSVAFIHHFRPPAISELSLSAVHLPING